MDDGNYHSIKSDNFPTISSNKAVIVQWSTKKWVDVNETYLKAELLEAINRICGQYVKYVIDELALTSGMRVLHLLLYHYELNPIELVLGQVKSDVGRNNWNYKLRDGAILFQGSKT